MSHLLQHIENGTQDSLNEKQRTQLALHVLSSPSLHEYLPHLLLPRRPLLSPPIPTKPSSNYAMLVQQKCSPEAIAALVAHTVDNRLITEFGGAAQTTNAFRDMMRTALSQKPAHQLALTNLTLFLHRLERAIYLSADSFYTTNANVCATYFTRIRPLLIKSAQVTQSFAQVHHQLQTQFWSHGSPECDSQEALLFADALAHLGCAETLQQLDFVSDQSKAPRVAFAQGNYDAIASDSLYHPANVLNEAAGIKNLVVNLAVHSTKHLTRTVYAQPLSELRPVTDSLPLYALLESDAAVPPGAVGVATEQNNLDLARALLERQEEAQEDTAFGRALLLHAQGDYASAMATLYKAGKHWDTLSGWMRVHSSSVPEGLPSVLEVSSTCEAWLTYALCGQDLDAYCTAATHTHDATPLLMLRLLDLMLQAESHEQARVIESVPLRNWLVVLPQLLAMQNMHSVLVELLAQMASRFPVEMAYVSAAEQLAGTQVHDDIDVFVSAMRTLSVLAHERWANALSSVRQSLPGLMQRYQSERDNLVKNIHLDAGDKTRLLVQSYEAIFAPTIHYLNTVVQKAGVPNEHMANVLATLPQAAQDPVSAWNALLNMESMLSLPSQLALDELFPSLGAVLAQGNCPLPKLGSATGGSEGGAVYVQSVRNEVAVLGTKRRPKRLVMTATDGNQHLFLLKGSEDLHQDQRIMQLLRRINEIMAREKVPLVARHYTVTPLGDECGLIEWVSNTMPLFQLYSRAGYGNPGQARTAAASSMNADLGTGEGRLEVFRALQEGVSADLLDKALWAHSQGPQHHWDMRHNYMDSCALMSMVGHVLGLGDRHLDNIMMDTQTGHLVHIDYNVCFDKGQKLAVPETVPFRLTRNMQQAMGIGGLHGYFAAKAQRTLDTLRLDDNRDEVLHMLQAFVYDPVVVSQQSDVVRRKHSAVQLLDSRLQQNEGRMQSALQAARDQLNSQDTARTLANLVSRVNQLAKNVRRVQPRRDKVRSLEQRLQDLQGKGKQAKAFLQNLAKQHAASKQLHASHETVVRSVKKELHTSLSRIQGALEADVRHIDLLFPVEFTNMTLSSRNMDASRAGECQAVDAAMVALVQPCYQSMNALAQEFAKAEHEALWDQRLLLEHPHTQWMQSFTKRQMSPPLRRRTPLKAQMAALTGRLQRNASSINWQRFIQQREALWTKDGPEEAAAWEADGYWFVHELKGDVGALAALLQDPEGVLDECQVFLEFAEETYEELVHAWQPSGECIQWAQARHGKFSEHQMRVKELREAQEWVESLEGQLRGTHAELRQIEGEVRKNPKEEEVQVLNALKEECGQRMQSLTARRRAKQDEVAALEEKVAELAKALEEDQSTFPDKTMESTLATNCPGLTLDANDWMRLTLKLADADLYVMSRMETWLKLYATQIMKAQLIALAEGQSQSGSSSGSSGGGGGGSGKGKQRGRRGDDRSVMKHMHQLAETYRREQSQKLERKDTDRVQEMMEKTVGLIAEAVAQLQVFQKERVETVMVDAGQQEAYESVCASLKRAGEQLGAFAAWHREVYDEEFAVGCEQRFGGELKQWVELNERLVSLDHQGRVVAKQLENVNRLFGTVKEEHRVQVEELREEIMQHRSKQMSFVQSMNRITNEVRALVADLGRPMDVLEEAAAPLRRAAKESWRELEALRKQCRALQRRVAGWLRADVSGDKVTVEALWAEMDALVGSMEAQWGAMCGCVVAQTEALEELEMEVSESLDEVPDVEQHEVMVSVRGKLDAQTSAQELMAMAMDEGRLADMFVGWVPWV